MREPAKLTVHLLGAIAVRRDGRRLALPPSRKARALLAYLAVTGRAQRRDRLCEMFWDIPDDARGALRTSLSKLRAIVDGPDRRRILAEDDAVRLDTGDVELDLLVARRALVPEPETESTETLERIAALFCGEFLEGLDLPNCPTFQAWCVAQREEMRQLHALALRTLIGRHAGAPDAALPHARALVTIDSDPVRAHALLLRLLLARGRRREAEEQYELSSRLVGDVDAGARHELAKVWHAAVAGSERAASGPAGTALVELAGDLTGDLAGAATAAAPARTEATTAVAPDCVETATVAERKQVTVLVATLPGLALAAAHLDPEEGAACLAPAMEAMTAVIHRYGGRVSQTFGDGLVALFGAPAACADHAVRACRAALDIEAAQKTRDRGATGIRIGIDSGAVVLRPAGRGASQAPEAFGPAVMVAQALAARAPGTGIRATSRTCALVRGLVEIRGPEPAAILPGLPPIDVGTVMGLLPVRSAWQARAALGLTAFVGREVEMATLQRALARAEGCQGQAVVVSAEPGVGKSRLVHELLASKAVRGWTVVQSAAVSFDQDTPYHAIKPLLRQWLMIEAADDAAAMLRGAERALAAFGPRRAQLAVPLLALLDVPQSDGWHDADPDIRRQRILEAVLALARHHSSQAPLLVVVEDLHWADKETLRVLDHLFERLAGLRLLLVVTCRPEAQPEWTTKSYSTVLRLLPLDPDTATRFVGSLLGTRSESRAIRRLLIERTQGTPLFLEEAVRVLIETGVVQGTAGDYALTRPVDGIVIPPTVQAVLAERIDRLPPLQKSLLQVASVIGDEVPLDILRPSADVPPDQLDEALQALQAAELIYETSPPPHRCYAFKHRLTCEAAYQSLLIERRRQLHAEVLATIETLSAASPGEHVDRLAHHALHSAQWSKAASYLQDAAERAVEKSAYREASRLLQSAIEALEHLPQDLSTRARSVDIRIRLRPVLTIVGDYDRSLAHLLEAERLAERIGDTRRLALVIVQKAYLLGGRGLLEDGIAAAARARALAEGLDEEPLRVSATLALAEAATDRADARRAIQLVTPLKRSLVGAFRHERAGMFGTLSTRGLGYLAISHGRLGRFDEAMALCHEALAIARELQRPIDLAYCRYRLGTILLLRGAMVEAKEALSSALSESRAASYAWLAPRIAACLGSAHAWLREGGRARVLLYEAIATAKANGLIMVEATAATALAEACSLDGDRAAAVGHGRRALALARQHGYWHLEIACLRLLGAHAPDSGEAQLCEALDLAAARGLQPEAAHGRLALARFLAGADRRAEAQEHFETGVGLYEAMGMTFWQPASAPRAVRVRDTALRNVTTNGASAD